MHLRELLESDQKYHAHLDQMDFGMDTKKKKLYSLPKSDRNVQFQFFHVAKIGKVSIHTV